MERFGSLANGALTTTQRESARRFHESQVLADAVGRLELCLLLGPQPQ